MRPITQHHTPSRNPYRTQNPVRATSCGFESHLRHSTELNDRSSLRDLPFIIGKLPHNVDGNADGNRIPPQHATSHQTPLRKRNSAPYPTTSRSKNRTTNREGRRFES